MTSTHGSAGPQPRATVGWFIERLRAFSPDTPIHLGQPLSSEATLIFWVSASPTRAGTVALLHTDEPAATPPETTVGGLIESLRAFSAHTPVHIVHLPSREVTFVIDISESSIRPGSIELVHTSGWLSQPN